MANYHLWQRLILKYSCVYDTSLSNLLEMLQILSFSYCDFWCSVETRLCLFVSGVMFIKIARHMTVCKIQGFKGLNHMLLVNYMWTFVKLFKEQRNKSFAFPWRYYLKNKHILIITHLNNQSEGPLRWETLYII